MVNIQDLHKKFGKNQVLSGVDLSISEGGIFAILGPNGSGKTTLIKVILGMVIPNKGDIKVLGENIKKNPEYRHKIDYLPQIANFPSNLKSVATQNAPIINEVNSIEVQIEKINDQLKKAKIINPIKGFN